MSLIITSEGAFIKIVPAIFPTGMSAEEQIRISDISDVNMFVEPECVAFIKSNGLSHSFMVSEILSINGNTDVNTPIKAMTAFMAIINP